MLRQGRMPPHPACFAIKAPIGMLLASRLHFPAQKIMYWGRSIAAGDRLFLFASETQGGAGLVARGLVLASGPVPRGEKARETPRVTLDVERLDGVTRPFGRAELRPFRHTRAGSAEFELDFKLYRQATNKIVGLSAAAGNFLDSRFDTADREQ